MKSRFTCKVVAAGISMTGALLAGGCGTTPPAAESMASAPTGTVTTFHRKSSGSLGTFDGPVVWTQSTTTWQGKPVVSSGSPHSGVTLHDPVTHGMIATLDPAGKPVMSFDPPVAYLWPLEVGKTWKSSHTVTLQQAGRTLPLQLDWKVESWGDVSVPAGIFKAYRVVSTNNLGEVETRWGSPKDSLPTIKRNVVRPVTHPQGAGVLDAELLSRALPAK